MSVNLPQNVCPGFFFPHVKELFGGSYLGDFFFNICKLH